MENRRNVLAIFFRPELDYRPNCHCGLNKITKRRHFFNQVSYKIHMREHNIEPVIGYEYLKIDGSADSTFPRVLIHFILKLDIPSRGTRQPSFLGQPKLLPDF